MTGCNHLVAHVWNSHSHDIRQDSFIAIIILVLAVTSSAAELLIGFALLPYHNNAINQWKYLHLKYYIPSTDPEKNSVS